MELDKPLIERILRDYPIDEWFGFELLDTGIHRNSAKISTTIGDLVIKQIIAEPIQIEKTMYIYDYLSQHGFPTPTPLKTHMNSYYTEIGMDYFVIQHHIMGKPPTTENVDEAREITRKIGKTMGRFHLLLQKIDLEKYKHYQPDYMNQTVIHKLSSVELQGNSIYFPDLHQSIERPFVVNQYQQWMEQRDGIDLSLLDRGICHNNLRLDDFLIVNGEISVVLNFGIIEYNYLLYDLSSFILYSGMYQQNVAKLYLNEFLNAYLSTSPISRSQLKDLRFFMKSRLLQQVFHFFTRDQYQYAQGIVSGIDDQDGYAKAVERLLEFNRIPSDFYKTLLDLQ